MYSSEDLERFYFQYQTEALPHGESLQSFCKRNKVPYNIFQKWYKDTRNKIVEVKVDVIPESNLLLVLPVPLLTVSENKGEDIRMWLVLRMSNGLHLSQKNLSYRDLVRLIEKLEGLC